MRFVEEYRSSPRRSDFVFYLVDGERVGQRGEYVREVDIGVVGQGSLLGEGRECSDVVASGRQLLEERLYDDPMTAHGQGEQGENTSCVPLSAQYGDQ